MSLPPAAPATAATRPAAPMVPGTAHLLSPRVRAPVAGPANPIGQAPLGAQEMSSTAPPHAPHASLPPSLAPLASHPPRDESVAGATYVHLKGPRASCSLVSAPAAGPAGPIGQAPVGAQEISRAAPPHAPSRPPSPFPPPDSDPFEKNGSVVDGTYVQPQELSSDIEEECPGLVSASETDDGDTDDEDWPPPPPELTSDPPLPEHVANSRSLSAPPPPPPSTDGEGAALPSPLANAPAAAPVDPAAIGQTPDAVQAASRVDPPLPSLSTGLAPPPLLPPACRPTRDESVPQNPAPRKQSAPPICSQVRSRRHAPGRITHVQHPTHR